MRIALIILYFLFSIASAWLAVFLIWITAFGVGWGGGSISIWELLWNWSGVVLISIYAMIAGVGLIKRSRLGFIFGYTIPISLFAGVIGECFWLSPFAEITFLEQLVTLTIQSILPALVFIALFLLERSSGKTSIYNYVISASLSLFIIGWYFIIFH